ncbi:YceI family protein [Vibrio astriarenae]|uniref:YceI family protein n=1 Tax=Vibrio astriarenae TaxID=1481923 RepID=A0A7Z2T2I2_9VIBR|nr:YceI family protein [Vibrio astriarenae]QIA63071.1 YceI family protein [Vibrio astriarenae]
MRQIIVASLFAFVYGSFSFSALAADSYQVDTDVSSVSFSTIKKQYIVEPAVITGLSGSLDENGKLSVSIPIKNIDTGVSIRNDRLGELFFNIATYPDVGVSAEVPMELMEGDTVIIQATIPASVTMYGKTQTLEFSLNLVRVGDVISVFSIKPVIVDSTLFGIPAESLTALSSTVGAIPISSSVAANVSLILKK